MKNFLILGAVMSMLAGCGGTNAPTPNRSARIQAPMLSASGPIANACLSSGRSARSRKLCGCIQSVANRTLTVSEQRRAVSFYSNPQHAQTVRQSDRYSDQKFWEAYVNYSEKATKSCG